MKLNEKGFIATSVLYCLAAVLAAVVFATIANSRTTRDYIRQSSNDIKEHLNGNIYQEFYKLDEVRFVVDNKAENMTNVYDESFYVIEDSGITDSMVKVISFYNFNSDGTINKDCGLSANFSTNCSGVEYSNYNNTLSYIREKILLASSSIDISAININVPSIEDLRNMGAINSENIFIDSYEGKSVIGNTDFWLNDGYSLVRMEGIGNLEYNVLSNSTNSGVRPILTIPKKYIVKVND